MKQLLKVLLIVVFVLATPLFLVLLSVRLSGFSAEYLKSALSKADVYTNAVTELNKNLQVKIAGVTPSYLKSKTEKLIDDTESWLKEKSASPPSLSFADLNPQGTAELKKLALELKAEQEAARKEAERTGQKMPELEQFDVNKFIEDDFSISLAEQLTPLKLLYKRVVYGLPILALILALSIVGIFLLGEGKEEKFHWLGIAFLVAAFWNILPVAAEFFGFKAMGSLLADPASELPSFVKPLYEILVNPLADASTKTGVIYVVILFALAIGFFVLSKKPRKVSRGKG